MKKLKLLILRGIPASGKSTFAREFIKDNSEDWVIVNRDSIRSMLGNYWVPSREKLVSDIEEDMIISAFEREYNVIIDATNLNPTTLKFFESIAEDRKLSGLDVEIEFKDFTISLEEAIERDKNRERTVGEDVIKRFYYKYYDDTKK